LVFRGSGVSGIAVSALIALPPLLLGLAIPYAVLHYRDGRGGERDPQLGLKTALYFFLSVSVLILLVGMSIIAVDSLSDLQLFGAGRGGLARSNPRSFSEPKRVGAALMFAGFTFGLLQFVIIHMATNNRRWPLVRRVFGGWRLAITGMVVMTMFTLLVIMLFQESVRPEDIQDFFAILFVWTPAWLIDLVLLRTRSQQYPPDEEPPPELSARRERKEGEGRLRRGEA
jgi:hypothetical protein